VATRFVAPLEVAHDAEDRRAAARAVDFELRHHAARRSDGYGCDWPSSAARYEKVAAVLTAELKSKLGW